LRTNIQEDAMTSTSQNHGGGSIVLIHRLWVNPLGWDDWIDRYTAMGHTVIARSWPGMEGSIEDLRRDPSAIARLGVTEIVDHYERIIRELDRPPSSSSGTPSAG
jgi:hypothetical protein